MTERAAVMLPGSRGRLRDLLPQHALDHFDRARAALTVAYGGTMLGTLARTVGRVSADPPRVMVALEAHPQIVRAVEQVGSFALNLIDESEDRLDRLTGDAAIELDGMTVIRGTSGHPLLSDSVAQLECSVHDAVSAGGLRIYVADVTDACARGGASLAGIDGDLRNFVASRDDATYHELRRAILERRFPLEDDIRVQDVVAQLEVTLANVTYALSRLAHEGLVMRRTSERFVVTPVDESLIVTLLHARRILMRGITDCLVTQLTEAEIASVLEAALETRRPAGTSDVGMENDRSVRVFQTFNELVVGLAGNSVLLDTYRRLSVPTVMGRILWRVEWSTLHDALSECAIEFAHGLALRDRERAIAAIERFNDCVHEYAVHSLRSHGGRV
jgi:DNA-binding GntR family transcriptional regulator